LRGIILIVLVGYFSKGFIHFAIAKLFGPLIWGRGFCGWACWTAAVLDWLPMDKKVTIPRRLRNLRYLVLAISIALPLYFVFILNYNVRGAYIGKSELWWMIIGSIIYYLLAIPLAYRLKDRRAFCKVLCPVSLVMKVPARFALIRRMPTGNKCTGCGICNNACMMDVDVMSDISQGRKVESTECVLCGTCRIKCPAGAIK
jgi:ferredoxin-type protein NapH